ncbi:MAG: hypothetical protein GXP30_10090 [Verrucomicrobia bacterium]|nr:hypothetical protein [Verrucomicrobiota bacterium]
MSIIITLILIGTLAILLELFLPGGIVGFIGVLCLIAACIITFIEHGLNTGLLVTLGVVTMTSVILYFWMKNFDRFPWIKPLILTETVGGSSSLDKNNALMHKSGETLTDLGPSGKALINGEKHDVIAESGYIDKGTPVTVVKADGSKIIVRSRP